MTEVSAGRPRAEVLAPSTRPSGVRNCT
jgi:hypothetical protein